MAKTWEYSAVDDCGMQSAECGISETIFEKTFEFQTPYSEIPA